MDGVTASRCAAAVETILLREILAPLSPDGALGEYGADLFAEAVVARWERR